VLVHEGVLVAEVNELVVGFIALEGDHVDQLYITPSFQGRGIGDKLMGMHRNTIMKQASS
jgi:ribosomal protein S18 acetylase RimI-like enzyme